MISEVIVSTESEEQGVFLLEHIEILHHFIFLIDVFIYVGDFKVDV
jgi:hypothetical protein